MDKDRIMKEKKTVLAVVLGVSLVSLISALVAAFADGLMIMFDGKELIGTSFGKHFNIGVGISELVIVGLGVAFIAASVFAYLKKSKTYYTAQIGLLSALGVCLIITTIVLRMAATFESSGSFEIGTMHAYERSVFVSYFATALTITVSTALVYISARLLRRSNIEDRSAAVAQSEVTEGKTGLADADASEAE